MAKAALWLGLVGSGAAAMLGLVLLLLALVTVVFDASPGWFILGCIGCFLVSGIAVAGAIMVEDQPGKGALLLFVAALCWAIASMLARTEGVVMFALPITLLNGLGSVFGWMEYRQRVHFDSSLNEGF